MIRRCRRSSFASSASSGFTLVEMLVVVTILGILASIATVGFRRYLGRARASEAVTMLAEVVSRQNLYYQEFAHYLPMRSDNAAVVTSGTGTELDTAFYPVTTISNMGDSARSAKAIGDVTAWPAQWRSLGVRPKDRALYCTYFANAGFRGTTPGASTTYGGKMLGSVVLDTPWWYVLGACNLNKTATWPAGVSVYGMSNVSPTLVTWNEGQ